MPAENGIVMTIHKQCADHLRAKHAALTGSKLSSGHAHELVAAYFGYGTGAALRAEARYPLAELPRADILIPDLVLMETRRDAIANLPADLPDVDTLSMWVSECLCDGGHFSGLEWFTRDLGEYIDTDFLQKDPMLIEDALSGEIASTNAFFDELYIEDVEIDDGKDVLTATVEGALNGENDQDRAFHGDSIAFSSVITFDRVAGRVAYATPRVETSGAVDESRYYGDDEDGA
jgi:hypothetical protein